MSDDSASPGNGEPREAATSAETVFAQGPPSAPDGRDRLDGWSKLFLAALIVISMGAMTYHSTRFGIQCDELEHLHAAWLWSQGLRPYVDFFEHHPPAYWLLLRPALNSHPRDLLSTLVAGRLLSSGVAILTVLAAWHFFASLLGRRAAWWGTGLLAAYFGVSRFVSETIPDMAAILLLVAGSALAIQASGWNRRGADVSTGKALLGGILMAGSCCVFPKGVFWCFVTIGILTLFALFHGIGRREPKHLRYLAVLWAGLLIPPAVQLAWVFTANDLAAFWACNVEVNRTQASSTLAANPTVLSRNWREAFSWPMASVPLAILGAVSVLWDKAPHALPRKFLVFLILGSTVFLALYGHLGEPYQAHFVVLVTGLGGAGMAAACERFSRAGRAVAGGGLLLAGLAWIYLLAACSLPAGQWELRDSLAPLQTVLDRASPQDTYIGVMGWNPVFMMDADPKLFMTLPTHPDEDCYREILNAIARHKPRYLVGFGHSICVYRGGMAKPGNWLRVLPTTEVLESYRPLFGEDLAILERLDAR